MSNVVTTLDVLRLAADLLASTDYKHTQVIAEASRRLDVEGRSAHSEAVNLCDTPELLDTRDKKLTAVLRAIATLEGR